MKNIQVLGSGCAKCIKTAEIISETAQALSINVNVIKETNPEVIMGYGVMSTPAVVIDEKLIHSGSIPQASQVKEWLVRE
ncbi:thioredoxin family protein [Neptunomonas sp.]|uniref:thioredoxin family protein n=1 Tax=Neptunomonas sp. TaxID=1971898 RepID=UPI00356648BB